MLRRETLGRLGAAAFLIVGTLLFAFYTPLGASLAGVQSAEPDRGAVDRLLSSTFADLAEHPVPLAPWRGKVLVVNFWASWCPPCREEMPTFSRLAAKYRDKGVQFVGIAIDLPANAKGFAERHPVDFPLVLENSDTKKLMRELGNVQGGLPYTVVIDQNGRAAASKLGRLEESQLDPLLARLAGER